MSSQIKQLDTAPIPQQRAKITGVIAGLVLALSVANAAAAQTIGELLEAASTHPNVEVSALAAQEAILRQEQAGAALYPKLTLFGKGELYNSPTNLRPMTPTEVNVAAGDSVPFSREILRYGLSLEAPLYVAKIYRLREKMTILAEKSAIAQKINLISRQAAVVSLNSAYQALSYLLEAVDGRKRSLDKTRADLRLKVDVGRAPESELLKIDNAVIVLEQQRRDLELKALDIQRDLFRFTGFEVSAPVAMTLVEQPDGSKPIALALDEKELAAQEKELERARAARYPTLSLYGTVSGNEGSAYNTDEHISRTYNFAGIVLSVPLFDRGLSSETKLAQAGRQKAAQKLAESRIDLAAREKNLKARLPVVAEALALAKRAVANDDTLLQIARISYDSGRTTTEEYLRYEAQALESQAAIAKPRDEKWQILMQQAVLYGVDLRGIVQ